MKDVDLLTIEFKLDDFLELDLIYIIHCLDDIKDDQIKEIIIREILPEFRKANPIVKSELLKLKHNKIYQELYLSLLEIGEKSKNED